MSKIKMLVMDVDGTLTDGKIYMGTSGEVMKAFSIKDGMMIARLGDYEIVPVIITCRSSDIVANRCKELNVTEAYQGIDDKVETLKAVVEKYHISFDEVAYIGDDLNDIKCIELCGFTGCPADAVDEVKAAVDFVCARDGGDGAVREFIEYYLIS